MPPVSTQKVNVHFLSLYRVPTEGFAMSMLWGIKMNYMFIFHVVTTSWSMTMAEW